MLKLGSIAGVGTNIYCDDTVTEFYVEKSMGLVPISLEQLRIIYQQKGIVWNSPTLEAEMVQMLGNSQSNRPVPVERSNSIWDNDNIKIGTFKHHGKQLELGYQNSTRCFFYFDGKKMHDYREEAVLPLVKGKGITWETEQMRCNVYELLGIPYYGANVSGWMPRLPFGMRPKAAAIALLVTLLIAAIGFGGFVQWRKTNPNGISKVLQSVLHGNLPQTSDSEKPKN